MPFINRYDSYKAGILDEIGTFKLEQKFHEFWYFLESLFTVCRLVRANVSSVIDRIFLWRHWQHKKAPVSSIFLHFLAIQMKGFFWVKANENRRQNWLFLRCVICAWILPDFIAAAKHPENVVSSQTKLVQLRVGLKWERLTCSCVQHPLQRTANSKRELFPAINVSWIISHCNSHVNTHIFLWSRAMFANNNSGQFWRTQTPVH